MNKVIEVRYIDPITQKDFKALLKDTDFGVECYIPIWVRSKPQDWLLAKERPNYSREGVRHG